LVSFFDYLCPNKKHCYIRQPMQTFTQQPQSLSAFAGFWHLPRIHSTRLESGQKVYAFVCFCYHLYTFCCHMYTFASLKSICLSCCRSGIWHEDSKKAFSCSMATSRALPISAPNYFKNLIFYYLLERRGA